MSGTTTGLWGAHWTGKGGGGQRPHNRSQNFG